MTVGPDRTRLNFADAVARRFRFLEGMGFIEGESEPTEVYYQNKDLLVRISHGKSSFELRLELVRGEETFSLQELVRVTSPEAAEEYRAFAATTAPEMMVGVDKLARLTEIYLPRALDTLPGLFDRLRANRQVWADSLALDVLERQVRPKAEEAFRLGHFGYAAELYGRIYPRLTSTEKKKLKMAQRKSMVE